MFRNPVPLDRTRHAVLRFGPAPDYRFAAAVSSAPLTFDEMARAAASYPIIFPLSGAPVPLALFGLHADENQFVDAAGRWTGSYVPAHIRRYPFMLKAAATPGSFTVLLDPEAPHFTEQEGEPLFGEDGEFGPAAAQAVAALRRFQEGLLATERLLQPLVAADVLVPQTLEVGRRNGEVRHVDGFRAVDMERVRALDDATLAAWVRNGLMRLIDAHLGSLAHIVRLMQSTEEKAS